MKARKVNYFIVLAIGILLMNAGILFNYFIPVHEGVIDFFKGLGISIVLASLWFAAKYRQQRSVKE